MASEVTSYLKFELKGLKNLGYRTHLALEGLCEINQTDGRTEVYHPLTSVAFSPLVKREVVQVWIVRPSVGYISPGGPSFTTSKEEAIGASI